MSLSRNSWAHLAEGLEVGQKKRVNHECGEGRTLIVSRDEKGYRAHCFRCGDSGSATGPAAPLAERLAALQRVRSGDASLARECSGRLELPMPQVRTVSDWPARAALWLYKAGLGKAEIGQLGAYYHPPSDRVVLPVLDSLGACVFWQARALDGRQPKYMAPVVDRSRIVPCWGRARGPTLVEDILSAFKVGLVAEGWSLMGTSASDYLVSRLLERKAPVNVWLDPDGPGQRAAAKVCKRLAAYGLVVRNIQSPKDPKLITREQIKEALWT